MRVLQKQVVSDFSNSLGVESAYQKELFKGVARIFQRGGGSHCVKHYRHGVFATEYCRLFALKKPTKGGGVTGTPGPPSLRPCYCNSFEQYVLKQALLCTFIVRCLFAEGATAVGVNAVN